ncbi:hypothetical protein BDZ97DRAFT_1913412 [Flammula alnicola]|nr:hypothetical protein BDZ97DRAFT_1913412 [Flammula alnicola]
MSLVINFLNTAYDYISPQSSPLRSPQSISREQSSSTTPLKERLDAACQSPTSTLANLSPTSMRRELDVSKHDLARAHVDSTQLKERCKMLERTLKETRELLRAREAEVEKLRRERDRERAMAERRRSDGNSLDTRMSSSDLARQMHSNRMHLHEDDARRTPSSSPSRNSLSSASASTSMSASSAGTGPSNGHSNGHGGTEEDRARLRSAETYMTRIDSWSGAQVLQAYTTSIRKFSSSLHRRRKCAISCPHRRRCPTRSWRKCCKTRTPYWAQHDAHPRSRDHSQDPLLVQLALQGCVSLPLADLQQHASNEPQPTSAKWRALTHQHIHAIYPTLTDYSINELSDTILRWCADILLIANCQSLAPSPTVQSPSSSPTISTSPPTSSVHQTPGAQLRSLYLDQIRRISGRSCGLRASHVRT